MPTASATLGEAHWAAREGIRDLFARYAWSFDTGDVEGYVATFTEGGVLDLPDGQFVGQAEIRAYAEAVVADPNFVGRQHFVGQSLFTPGASAWTVRSYAMITQLTQNTPPCMVSVGHYLDECIESDQGWRFTRRTFRRWGGDVLWRFETP